MDVSLYKNKYSKNDALEKANEIEKVLANRSVDNSEIPQLSKNLSYYSQVAVFVSSIQKALTDLENTQYILEKEDDAEIRELATEEIKDLETRINDLEKELKLLKISKVLEHEDDDRAAIIEIRAGAGGEEASLFAHDLFRMYKNYSLSKGWDFQVIDSSISEAGGYKEVVAQIIGKNVFKFLKYESGVHRVQRVPTTESSGRIHTSTASVAILPEAKDVDIQINPEDIKIDVMRASGAGGQCVNKTDSAVRITHLSSGIVVSCQETKHQAQNKEKAMAILRAKLYDLKKAEEDSKRDSIRSKMIGSAMRSEKIRTYNFPQNRITDHRVKKSWFNIEEVMNGDLEEMIKDINEGLMDEFLTEAEENGEIA